MNTKKHILFIQHAIDLGGAVISLKEIVIDALHEGYQCTVICPNKYVAAIYLDIGADTKIVSITPFNHNTALYYRIKIKDIVRLGIVLIKSFISGIQLINILGTCKPDLIHLNSSTLILYLPLLRFLRLKTVLHIRENIVQGYVGLRRWLIKIMANTLASHIIFISEFEWELLQTNPIKSSIIYNYVHENNFYLATSPLSTQKNKNIQLISLGGLSKIKGGAVLLQAISTLEEGIDLHILGAENTEEYLNRIRTLEGDEYWKKIVRLLQNNKVKENVKFFGRVEAPATHISTADGLIFWAGSPHFPRPVFEAWLLKKPVLYFNPAFKSKFINANNVLEIAGENPEDVKNAIKSLQLNHNSWSALIQKNYSTAKENFTERNFHMIKSIYENLIKSKLPHD